MWSLPGPGTETVFPALAGGSLSTVPPRKSQINPDLMEYFYKTYIFNKTNIKIFFLIFASIMYEYPLNLSISLSGGKETK